jgi:hypothetical protein
LQKKQKTTVKNRFYVNKNALLLKKLYLCRNFKTLFNNYCCIYFIRFDL